MNAPATPPKVNYFRNLAFAIRTIIMVLPALGGGRERENPPPGMGIKYFVIAGIFCGVVLVGSIITVARLVLHFATS